MPLLDKLKKNMHLPVALIFKGASPLGVELSQLLIEQGAFVITVDEYNSKNKKNLDTLPENKLFHFIDISGLESLVEAIKKLDYIFYLNSEYGKAEDEVSTSEFLESSNNLDSLLKLGVDKKSKFLLSSSIHIHRALQEKKQTSSEFDLDDEGLSYTVLEVHRYAENLTWEYYKKGGLDARIVRIGQLLGEKINLNKPVLAYEFIKDAISGQKIRIQGDGLENEYFVHILDAAYGLIKAMFTDKTSGEIYSLNIPRDITTLNLAYKIQDLEPRSEGIEFVDQKNDKKQINIYKPAHNLKSIGWKPNVSFERALAQTIDYAYDFFGKEKTRQQIVKKAKPVRKNKKSKSSIKNQIIDFFFETKDKNEKKKSVLDSLKYKSSDRKVLDVDDDDIKDRIYMTNKPSKEGQKRPKTQTFTWKMVSGFNKLKVSIRSLSLIKLSIYSILFVLIILAYVFVFVPGMRLAYYGYKTGQSVKSLEHMYSEKRFENAEAEVEKLEIKSRKVLASIDKLSFLSAFNIRAINELESYFLDINIFSQDLKEQIYYFDQLDQYLSQTAADFEINIEGNKTGGAPSEAGNKLQSYSSVDCEIDRLNDSFYNVPIAGSQFKSMDEKLYSLSTLCFDTNNVLNISKIVFGSGKEETWAVLLLDEKKVTPKGGQIIEVGIYSIEDGVFNKTKFASASEIELNFADQQNTILKQELAKLYPEDQITFTDLSYLTDDEVFEDAVKDTLKTFYGNQPDHIALVNYQFLEHIVDLSGSVSLSDGKVVTTQNMHEDIIFSEELFPKVLEKIFSFKSADINMLIDLIKNSYSRGSLVLYTESGFWETVTDKDQVTENGDFLKLSFAGGDAEQIPQVNIVGKAEVKLSSVETEFVIQVDEIDESFVSTIVVDLADDFEILSIKGENTEVTDSSSKIFASISGKDGNFAQLVVRGQSPSVEKKSDKSYNYNIKFDCGYKGGYYLEYVLDYGNELSLIGLSEQYETVDTTVRIQQHIENFKNYNLEFSSI